MPRILLFCLFFIACRGEAALAHPLEDGLVISDPEVVHAIEGKGFGFADLIAPRMDNSKECPSAPGNSLFGKPPLCQIARLLKERVDKAQKFSLDAVAKEKANPDTHFPSMPARRR